MSSKNYDTLEGELTVRGANTVARAGETNAVAIVGGYDASNAASKVTAGQATAITDPAAASDTFGNSEIARAAQAISANGVGTMYGVPVPETQNTESISSGASITLSETPVFNPELHPDHEITVTDTDTSTDLNVNVVYANSPSTPSEADTVNVNPINGAVEIDASGNYDVTYTYGDYQTAVNAAADLPVRYLYVGTESDSVKATVLTELSDIAADFDFKRAFMGTMPAIDVADISSYTPNQRNWRLVEVAPPLATGANGPVRTAAAICGSAAAQSIGPDGSVLYDAVNGITSLNTSYRASEIKDFDAVTALTRNREVGRAETTSDVEQFSEIYVCEIIDDVALDLFETAKDYAGGPQDLQELETLLNVVCQGKASGNPPLLGFGDGRDQNPYSVTTSFGTTNDVANAGVSIVPYPIAQEVNLDMTVTDGFVQFEGAN